MSQNYTVQGYTFTLTKKNDTSLSITACPDVNKSIFESGSIDLKKVRFETVGAALSNSNPANIHVKLHYQEGNHPFTGQLLLSIIVKYEFLPEFSEEIILKERKLDQNDAVRVRLAKLEAEVQGLGKSMDIITNQGTVKVEIQKSISLVSSAKDMDLKKGKYLIQISGLNKSNGFTNISFTIEIQGKSSKAVTVTAAKVSPYFVCASYTFPFSLSELIELSQDSHIKVQSKEGTNYSSSSFNYLVTAKPVLV